MHKNILINLLAAVVECQQGRRNAALARLDAIANQDGSIDALTAMFPDAIASAEVNAAFGNKQRLAKEPNSAKQPDTPKERSIDWHDDSVDLDIRETTISSNGDDPNDLTVTTILPKGRAAEPAVIEGQPATTQPQAAEALDVEWPPSVLPLPDASQQEQIGAPCGCQQPAAPAEPPVIDAVIVEEDPVRPFEGTDVVPQATDYPNPTAVITGDFEPVAVPASGTLHIDTGATQIDIKLPEAVAMEVEEAEEPQQ